MVLLTLEPHPNENCIWKIRGLNDFIKQDDVKYPLQHKGDIMRLVETKLPVKRIVKAKLKIWRRVGHMFACSDLKEGYGYTRINIP